MKKNIFSCLLLCIIFLTIHCKKDSNQFDIIGTWETIVLRIDGIDTTSHLKADTNCYGYLRFFTADDDIDYIDIQPAKGSNNGFYCSQHGHWFILGKKVTIDFVNASLNTTGAYLLDDRIRWDMIETSERYMNLHVSWNGSEYEWILRKI